MPIAKLFSISVLFMSIYAVDCLCAEHVVGRRKKNNSVYDRTGYFNHSHLSGGSLSTSGLNRLFIMIKLKKNFSIIWKKAVQR